MTLSLLFFLAPLCLLHFSLLCSSKARLTFGVNNILDGNGHSMQRASLAHRHLIQISRLLEDIILVYIGPCPDVDVTHIYTTQQ